MNDDDVAMWAELGYEPTGRVFEILPDPAYAADMVYYDAAAWTWMVIDGGWRMAMSHDGQPHWQVPLLPLPEEWKCSPWTELRKIQ